MAHFAEIGLDNVVLRVLVVNDDVLLDADGNASENLGQEFCRNLLGGTWIQTSKSGSFRKNFATKNYTYDSARDAFIPPQPFDSWVLDEETARWVAPVIRPEDDAVYQWDEPTQTWFEV